MRVLTIHGDGAVSHTGAVDMPPLGGFASPARLQRIAAAMRGHDLILTHGWDAINAALAHTVFARHLSLAPLVHHEEQPDPSPSRRRTWTRRLALRGASAVIVPGERLRALALRDWQQPSAQVRVVPPGIDLAPFARKPRADALPRLIKRRGERWLGALGHDEGAAMLDTLAGLPDAWQLVWLGEGPPRDALRAEALMRDLAHRVHAPGTVSAADAFGLLDLIVLPPDAEPAVAIGAMAAGLPIAAPPSADLAELLAPENAGTLGEPPARLAADEPRLRTIGEANRTRARSRFDERRTRAMRQAIYDEAMTVRPAPAPERTRR